MKSKKVAILIIVMTMAICMRTTIYTASANNVIGDYINIYDADGKIIISFKIFDQGDIFMYGNHVRSGADYAYRTIGHSLALHPSDKNPKSLGANNYCFLEREEVKNYINSGVKDPNIITDVYQLSSNAITNALVSLMKTDRDEKGNLVYPNIKAINAALASEEGVTIYLSNAFTVIDRSEETQKRTGKTYVPIGDPCYSLDEIMNEIKKLTGYTWSNETQKILPYYYDIPITFKLQPFYYNVVYISEEDYSAGRTSSEYILGTAATGITAICGSEVEYRIEDPSNIEINSQLYEFTGASYYAYWGKNLFYDTEVEDGDTIRTTHDYQRDSTMYIVVRSKGDNPVSVDYVDEDGNALRNNISAGAATENYPYSYSPEEILQIGNSYYQYTGQWSYSYIDNKGKLKESGKLSGNPNFTLRDAGEREPIKIQAVYKDIGKAEERVTSFSYIDPEAAGVIAADDFGDEKYDVKEGIPSSETLYTTIQAKEYLLDIEFVRKSGKKIYPVSYERTYYLHWTEPYSGEVEIGEDGEPLPTPAPISQYDTETVKGTVLIERDYAYTEVVKIDYYKIEYGEIKNDALPDKTVILKPSGYEIPSLNYSHDSKESSHITDPAEVTTTIKLPSKSITSDNYFRPNVPMNNEYAEVDTRISEITVKNDYLEFDETVILDASQTKKKTANAMIRKIRKAGVTDKHILFASDLEIPAELANGVYPTEGTIIYRREKSLNSTLPDTISAEVDNLNIVQVHTPVYCFGELTNDNKQYVQLVNPDLSAVPIVLDETGISNDFVVSISNTGYHTDKKGYREQNYDKYVAEENGIKLNQVKFSFDVLIDVENDGKTENDIILKKDNWYTVGIEQQRFYVPLYVEEGSYEADFRSVAINGTSMMEESEIYANRELIHYVAENSAQVQISGKLYGLTVYDISDYPLWQNVFRKVNGTTLKINDNTVADGTKTNGFNASNSYTYTVGTKNETGNTTGRLLKYTFPIFNGSHPLYKNQGAVKEGYTVRFTLDTLGNVMEQQASKIRIKPYFYFVSADGKKREEVDVYYHKQQGKKSVLVQIGSEAELTDTVIAKTGDYLLGIPETELKDTASVLGVKLSSLKGQTAVMYRYSLIESNPAFKTFSGDAYATELLNGLSRAELLEGGITRTTLLSKKQSYYFNYSIPSDAIAVTKGTDLIEYAAKKGLKGSESFLKKDGYLMVNIEITAYDDMGKAYMSYINQENYLNNGQGCMWLIEGAPLSKTDSSGNTFSLRAGDFLMFRLDESVKDDYRSGGIY